MTMEYSEGYLRHGTSLLSGGPVCAGDYCVQKARVQSTHADLTVCVYFLFSVIFYLLSLY